MYRSALLLKNINFQTVKDQFNIKLVDKIEGQLKDHFETHNFKFDQGYVLLEIINIRVQDPYVARDIAEDRLQTIKNTSQLFFHRRSLKWNSAAIVVQQCCKNEAILAKNQINPMKKASNCKSSEVAENTNKIFKNISLYGESFNKFNRVMELHSNCITFSSPENQIVNLWTILETLVPSSKNKSKVQNICDAIIPILLLKYFQKLISNLFNDYRRWNEELIADHLKDIEPDDNNILQKFALFLCDEKHCTKRDKIYAELGHFVLLRNRTFKLSKILSSKEKTQKYLERHKKNVMWQIRRVYRTRNMIVHSGKSPKYINILVENTHDYIDQVTSEIIDMTTSNYRINYLDQAFEFGKIIYAELEREIERSSFPEDFATLMVKGNRI
jgi:hypothetical protein